MIESIGSDAENLLKPISKAAPAGENAVYDPRHQAVRDEVAKLESPNADGIDWATIGSNSADLLRSTTKDLLIACYMTRALYELHGLEGVRAGLASVVGFVDNFWEAGFPPQRRQRARSNALNWLVDKLEPRFSDHTVEAGDRAHIASIGAAIARISSETGEKLQDPPMMHRLRDCIQRMELALPAEAPPPEPAPAREPPPPADRSTPAPPDQASTTAPAPSDEPPMLEATPETKDATGPEAAPNLESPESAAPPPKDPEPSLDAILETCSPFIAPIPGDAPGGTDAKFGEEHQTTRTEVAKRESASAGNVDWQIVATHATTVLTTQSKDILIASYLAFAKYELEGLDGLNAGLVILAETCDRFWAEAFPPARRLRGRGNALGWLVTQLEGCLSDTPIKADDRLRVGQLKLALDRLDSVVSERFDGEGPSLRPLFDSAERLRLSIPVPKVEKPKPKPQPKPKAAPAAKTSSNASSASKVAAPAAVAGLQDVGEIDKFLTNTGNALVQAAKALRKADNKDPRAYRLLRQGLWMRAETCPPSDAGGKTMIPALPPDVRAQLGAMANNAKWDAVLDTAESSLPQFRFCLDLHRFSHAALTGLGSDHERAKQALVSEVAGLISRLPELPRLLANDGSPLADGDTMQWINTAVAAAMGGGGGGDDDGLADDENMDALRKVLGSDKRGDAGKLANRVVEASRDGRQRALRAIAVAEAYLGANEPAVASVMLAGLERELDRRDLGPWDPRVLSRCLSTLIRACRSHRGNLAAKPGPDTPNQVANLRQRELALLERLGGVDVEAASKLAVAEASS